MFLLDISAKNAEFIVGCEESLLDFSYSAQGKKEEEKNQQKSDLSHAKD